MKKIILLAGLTVLLFTACDKEKRECPSSAEQTFSLTGYSKINAGETFNLTILKGNNFSIKATGCSNDLADLDLTVGNGNMLEIKYKNYKRGRYRVDFTITLPSFNFLSLSGDAAATVSGFTGQNSVIRYVLSGNSTADNNGTGINANIELSGASSISLNGNTESLYGNISGNARLHAYELAATEVDIIASGTAKAYVAPLQAIYAEASGEARVYYRGNPPTTAFSASGNGRIIKE